MANSIIEDAKKCKTKLDFLEYFIKYTERFITTIDVEDFTQLIDYYNNPPLKWKYHEPIEESTFKKEAIQNTASNLFVQKNGTNEIYENIDNFEITYKDKVSPLVLNCEDLDNISNIIQYRDEGLDCIKYVICYDDIVEGIYTFLRSKEYHNYKLIENNENLLNS